MSQYTTQMLLPDVVKRIDDIVEENFTIPAKHTGTRESANERVPDVITYDASHFPLRSSLTAEQVQRLNSINRVFSDALRGKRITIQRLRRVLKDSELAEYDEMLEQPASTLEIAYGSGEPGELRRYKQLVKEADFAYWQFESMSAKRASGKSKYKPQSIAGAQSRADTLYERALEHLQELYARADRGDYGAGKRAEFDAWLDRGVGDFGVDSKVGIGPVLIPRVRGSKSHNAQDAGLPKLSKRLKQQWAALNMLLVVATDIAFVVPQQQPAKTGLTEEQMNRMRCISASINPERD